MYANNKKDRPISAYSFTPVATNDRHNDENEKSSDDCGVGCCKPRWLQVFSRPIVFMFIFCFVGMIQGATFTYFVGVITTVEKRYAFKSKVTGIISIADNLSPVLISLLVGFFGGRGHKTRWIAFGTFIAALSVFVSSMPYLIFGPSQKLLYGVTSSMEVNATLSAQHLCEAEAHDSCDNDESSQRSMETLPAVALLFLGNFINGIGSTAFYIVGTPYLDDNIKKTKAPLYFAVMFSVRLFGPTLGFVLSSAMLGYYEDPSINPDYDKSDPRWIGAWWIGFNILAGLLIIGGSLLSLFPKRLKWANDESEARIEQPELPLKEKAKEFPKAVKALLRNPILMCQNISLVFYLLGMLGFFLFLPKYFETQFRQPAQKANMLSGITTIGFMALGFLLSGSVIYRFKPSPRVLSGWNVFLGFLSVGFMIAMGLIGCSNKSIVTDGMCMEDCHCTRQVYNPVCHQSNSTTYFSPCHAGCTDTFMVDGKRVFDNCECTEETLTTGYCDEGCNAMMYYIIVMAASKLIGSTGRIGNALVTLRCVPPEDKSLALSTGSFFLSIFAFIPYPLVYGAIVDSVCIEWESTCGEIGNCWVYDAELFRKRFHGFTAGFFALSVVFDIFVWYYSKNIKSLYEDPKSEPKKRAELKSNAMSDTVRYNWAGSKSSLSGF